MLGVAHPFQDGYPNIYYRAYKVKEKTGMVSPFETDICSIISTDLAFNASAALQFGKLFIRLLETYQ